MGRDTTKASGNVWYEARMRAAQYNDALRSQDSTAAMAGVGRDAITRIEHDANKVMPVNTAVVTVLLILIIEFRRYDQWLNWTKKQ